MNRVDLGNISTIALCRCWQIFKNKLQTIKNRFMKKFRILFLLVLTLSLTNCSNDDNSSETNKVDLIIGKWKLIERTEDGTELTISGCELENFTEYLSDGKVKDTYYEPDSENIGECIEFIDNSGNWNNISDSNYNITLDDGDLDYNALISFTQNNTIHTQTYAIIDGGESHSYVAKYQKIE